MSAELPPTEIVPIFNPTFFLGAADPFTKAVADNLYLQYPIGQGTEIIPDLVVSGGIQADNNITMAGTAGVNYIEFPDATKQFTSSAGAGINITDTNTSSSRKIRWIVWTRFKYGCDWTRSRTINTSGKWDCDWKSGWK